MDGNLTFSRQCFSFYTSGTNAGKCITISSEWDECGETGAIIDDNMFDELEICETGSGACETNSYSQGSGMADTDIIIYT